MILTFLAALLSRADLAAPLLVTLAVAATVLWSLAAIAARLLRRSSAAIRHQVWMTATLSVLLAPLLLPSIQQQLPLRMSRPRVAPVTIVAPPTAELASNPDQPLVGDTVPSDTFPAATAVRPRPNLVSGTSQAVLTPPATSISWWGLLVGLWGCGVVLQLVFLLRARLQVRALLRRARDLGQDWIGSVASRRAEPLRLANRVRFCESTETAVPFVTGLFRPTVVLPFGSTDWSPARLEAVVLHELLHVRRRDLWMQSLTRLAVALTWFHPLAWLALQRTRTEAEHATDDAVLTTGACSSVDYAEHFLAIARQVARATPPLQSATSMAGRSSVEARLRSILDRSVDRRPVRAVQFCLLLPGTLVAIVATAWVTPGRAELPAASKPGSAIAEVPAHPDEAKPAALSIRDSAAPATTANEPSNSADAAIHSALEKLDRLDLKEPRTLREVIAQLAWKHRIPVRLEEIGFNQSDCGSQILVSPVSLEEASVRSILMQLLEQHLTRGGEAYSPRLIVRDGMLGISAGENLYAIHDRGDHPDMSRVMSIRGTVHRVDGTPAAAARLEAWTLGASTFVVADEKGEFAIPLFEGSRHRLLVFAQGELGTVAMAALPDPWEAVPNANGLNGNTPIRLVLEPSSGKEAKVVDVRGEPVEGARVELIVSGRPISGLTTNGAGRLRMRFPAALPVEAILFWKRGAGFDYRRFDAEPFNARPAVRTFGQLSAELESTLVGAERTTFVLTDRKGQPLPGIRVRPSSVQFVKEAGGLRLPELGELGDVTNAAGEVTFDWLPRVPSSMTRFYHTSNQYTRHIMQELGGDEPERRETIPLVRKTRVAGHVRTVDGRPVPGARVSGMASVRKSFLGFRAAVADQQGAYELDLDPGCHAMLLAHSPDRRFISPARDDLLIAEEGDLEDVDFVLQRGTRLFGSLLDAPVGTAPSQVGFISLILTGRGLKELPDVDLESIPGAGEFLRSQVNINQNVSEDLKYEFYVGPGVYSVSSPRNFRSVQGIGRITVTDQEEIQNDYRYEKRTPVPPLRGRIVVGESSTPVPEARLRVLRENSSISTSSAVADKAGDFEITLRGDPTLIAVFSPDRKLGAIHTFAGHPAMATVPVYPTATVRLRVLNDQQKRLTGKVVVRSDFEVRDKVLWNSDPPVSVPKDGILELPGMIVGTSNKIQISLDGGTSFQPLISVTPDSVGPIDLGDVQVERIGR